MKTGTTATTTTHPTVAIEHEATTTSHGKATKRTKTAKAIGGTGGQTETK